MAVLAIPLIEAIALRVLIALGIGAAAGEAAEEVKEALRKKDEEAERAKTTPLARAEEIAKTKKKCDLCEPDCGALFTRSTAGWSEISIAYQARISGFSVGPGFINEWMFKGITFDGFESEACLLKEAKAKFDQFFDDFGQRKPWWQGDTKMIEQAVSQSLVAVPQPPIRLQWYFMESKSYRYFSQIFTGAKFPIVTVFHP